MDLTFPKKNPFPSTPDKYDEFADFLPGACLSFISFYCYLLFPAWNEAVQS